MDKIAKAFCRAQREFAPALKTNTNPHFESKYVGLDGCVEAVIDALNNNGIALVQKPHDCESGVKIETVFIHESGEVLSGGILHVPASKQDPQGYGSALTYARRYGLMAACGIAPEDDDGNAASKPKTSPAPNLVPPPLSQTEMMACQNTMASCDDLETLKSIFGGAWKRANDEQKEQLQEAYNTKKSLLEKAA